MTDSRAVFDSTPQPPGSRFAARVEYHGGYYHGWQAQPHLDCETVQETLERALSSVAAQAVKTVCAGRTDTGVHGFGQVIHFDDPVGRSAKAWVMGGNSGLPSSVRLHWAVPVRSDFHARFSALNRRYRYIIANTPVKPAQMAGLVAWHRNPLDAVAMDSACRALLGEQDFSAFRAASCQSASPCREVRSATVRRQDEWVIFDIVANAFLHHMVRNIVGALIMIGRGLRPSEWIAELLVHRDRRQSADTAAGDGLHLVGVEYPDEFDLPPTPDGPMFLRHV